MKWGTCALEAYCHSWGVPDREWDIHNESQLATVDLIEIQECYSGLDCRSQLCLNFNHSPGLVLATVPGYPAAVRVVTRNTGVPGEFGDGLEPDRSSILRFLQLFLQLSIWILIVSRHDPYVKCADWCLISSPILRFAIGLVFIQSFWN